MRFCLVENYWPFLHAESLLILMQYVDNIENRFHWDGRGLSGSFHHLCVCNDMT